MNFKNRNGFTLIETMVAIAVAAIALTPLFILQGTTLQSIMRFSYQIERFFMGKQFLYEMRKELKPEQVAFIKEKKIEEPLTTLKYTLDDSPKQSSLSSIAGLRRERVVINWKDFRVNRKEQLISFLYKPEQKK